ncbi:replicative DNA helicase [Pectobacterium carotovorum]|uniref:replicative DNA helicase n=1 Tax=Pectobacterium carotovorum TaxID=554 RepID=UPI0021F39327|nr:DnaB-like helicase C-terminal domain-containing protein [Pectobacterium carotovorum]
MGEFVPPHNTDAEQATLGGLMLHDDDDLRGTVLSMLKPESFYHRQHRLIYQCITDLIKDHQPIDMITLSDELTTRGEIEVCGGFSYLADICKIPAAANVLAYAGIVRDNAMARYVQRKLAASAEIIVARGSMSIEERLSSAQQLVNQAFEATATGRTTGLRPAMDVVDDWLAEVEKRFSDPDHAGGLTLGIEDLDRIMAPKQVLRGSLVVVGARPKMGKTAFYNRVATHFALNHRLPTLLFSLEMTDARLIERMVSQESRVSSNVFYIGGYEDTDMSRAGAFAKEIAESNMFIDSTPGISLAHVTGECRRIKRQRGAVGLVAIDYLTLMRGEAAERRDISYGAITTGLKNLAKELDCVVLLLTQLNRSLEQRADKRPLPSDSKDTGQIEQDCDVWIGLYREGVYDENADPQLTEVILRLNREGPSGTAHVLLTDGYFRDTTDEDIAQRRSRNETPRARRYTKKETIQAF